MTKETEKQCSYKGVEQSNHDSNSKHDASHARVCVFNMHLQSHACVHPHISHFTIVLCLGDVPSKAKIGNFDGEPLSHQDVPGTDVPVQNLRAEDHTRYEQTDDNVHNDHDGNNIHNDHNNNNDHDGTLP